jgi:activator of HSP90 ATPase
LSFLQRILTIPIHILPTKNRQVQSDLQRTKKQVTSTIRQKVWIPGASPENVYRALLSSKEHSTITGTKASVSSRKGAKFTAWDGYISGRNLALTKGKKIVQEWQTTEWPEGYAPSRLEITLAAKKGGTELGLVQTEVPKSQAAEYRQGWIDCYWEPMKKYFETKKTDQ